MADLTSGVNRLEARAHAQAHRVSGPWVEKLARFGYAAKGVVYLVIGVLALQAAMGTGGATEGARGAIWAIARQPFGQVLLGLMAVGLAGFVIWRFAQAFLDAEAEGTDAKGLFKRVGYAISGVAYGLLAVLALRIVFAAGGGAGGSRDTWTAQLMAQPFGPWLVGLVGLVIIGVGLYHFYKVVDARFMRDYKISRMNPREIRWTRRSGQLGLSARGVAFVIIGILFIQAAVQLDPSEAGGLDAALTALAQQPYGPWLLGIVAIGLVAYGVYCFSKARYRHFEAV